MKTNTNNKSTDFELFAQRVYQALVNNTVLKSVKVQHDVKKTGKSGCEHQIDVYWEYEVAGVLHKVAIECKNYKSSVPIGKVRDFFGVLQDIGGISGVMVSSVGYQDGAKKYANHYGISLKTLRHPVWGESFGSICHSTHVECRHCLFQIDDDWAKRNGFDLTRFRNRFAVVYSFNADYWKNATHIPIETTDSIIRNSKGEKITSIEELGEQIPDPRPGNSFVFKYDDAHLNSRHWGQVKITEVMFEYEASNQQTILNLAAYDFVEGILCDAINGKIDYVGKE